jgi:cell division protein FtsL
MKTDKYFVIKLNDKKILITAFILLSIIFFSMFMYQKSEIEMLKTDMAIQKNENEDLKRRINSVESQNYDLESQVSNLQDEIENLDWHISVVY